MRFGAKRKEKEPLTPAEQLAVVVQCLRQAGQTSDSLTGAHQAIGCLIVVADRLREVIEVQQQRIDALETALGQMLASVQEAAEGAAAWRQGK
jgi:hypothetical protein